MTTLLNEIHETAIIEKGAELGKSNKIGPYCHIGPNVKLGESNTFNSHVVVKGHTTIENNNKFFQFSSIGEVPQDLTYNDEPTRLEIGSNNTIREGVTLNLGTLKQDSVTKIGNNCLIMAYVHVGHDAIINNNVVIANSVNLAGHVNIHDNAVIGGGCSVSQFISIGEGAYIGGMSAIDRDIPCFCTGYGNRIKLRGINIIGMKRLGYNKSDISEFVDFFRSIEASALSPRSYINKHIKEDNVSDKILINKFVSFINDSDVGIAPYN
jgi:UDP-N-acetylglucosamine acyltransferase